MELPGLTKLDGGSFSKLELIAKTQDPGPAAITGPCL